MSGVYTSSRTMPAYSAARPSPASSALQTKRRISRVLLLLSLVAVSVSAQSAPHFVEVTRAAGIDFPLL